MNRGAFTLIEALAAILLMALILPTALTGVSQALRVSGALQRQHIALELAETKMAELLSDGSWQNSAQSGAFDKALFGELSVAYKWTLEVDAWRDATVRHVRVTVSWSDSEHDQISIETLATPEVQL